MPVYYSQLSSDNTKTVCGTALMPLKTTTRGPAPPSIDNAKDIVDEAIEFFRANVLFRNFSPKNPQDLLLAYLTVFITELLRFHAKDKTLQDAKKNITRISLDQRFTIPGEKDFAFAGFFTAPASAAEQKDIREYLLQVRQECANRLLDRIYNADGTQNKWWFQFSKRKFLNIDNTGSSTR
eukprot:UN00088